MLRLQITPKKPEDANSEESIEILSALFNSYEVDGVEILENGLLVYISEPLYTSAEFKAALEEWQAIISFSYQLEELPDINWNKEWESNFDPVFVDDFLTIKADFHNLSPTTKHTITINPKMSFGTGHHETTWMMSKMTSLLDFRNKKVMDAGSGTGVLAILAKILGAKEVIAFDNDSWCYDNALENFEVNKINDIKLIDGSLEAVNDDNFDVILANINRNFIIANGENLVNKLNDEALLIISGFLNADAQLILDYFHGLNMVAQYLLSKGEWACVALKKH